MWLSTSVIRHIIIYAAIMINQRFPLEALRKIQRIAWLSMTGVTKSCPTSVLEVILCLKLLSIYIQKVAVRSALGILKTSDFNPGYLNGHLEILGVMHKDDNRPTNSDNIFKKTDWYRKVGAQIPLRCDIHPTNNIDFCAKYHSMVYGWIKNRDRDIRTTL